MRKQQQHRREQTRANYIYDDGGYVYVKSSSTRFRIQVRCRRYRNGCSGRASLDLKNNKVDVSQPHNHPPEKNIVDEDRKFIAELLKEAKTTAISYLTIYNDVAPRHVNAANRNPFKRMRERMRLARTQSTPPVPKSLQNWANIIEDDVYKERYARTQGNHPKPFFLGSLHQDGNYFGFMLGNRNFIQTLSETSGLECIVTAIIPCKPDMTDVTHLFVIGAVYHSLVVPLVYVLMNQNMVKCYIAAFKEFKNLFPVNFRGLPIILDCDPMLRNAVKSIIPEAKVMYSSFMYMQALAHWIKKEENADIFSALQTYKEANDIVEMIFILPYLPTEPQLELPDDFTISNALNLIEDKAKKSEVWVYLEKLFQHHRKNFPPATFSVYDNEYGTNIHIEQLITKIIEHLGANEQEPWHFYDIIRRLEVKFRCKYNQIMDFQDLRNRCISDRVESDKRIKVVMEKAPIHISLEEFLSSMTYVATNYLQDQLKISDTEEAEIIVETQSVVKDESEIIVEPESEVKEELMEIVQDIPEEIQVINFYNTSENLANVRVVNIEDLQRSTFENIQILDNIPIINIENIQERIQQSFETEIEYKMESPENIEISQDPLNTCDATPQVIYSDSSDASDLEEIIPCTSIDPADLPWNKKIYTSVPCGSFSVKKGSEILFSKLLNRQ